MPNIIKLTPSLCGCSPIQIGYRVENDARAIEFDFTEWSDESDRTMCGAIAVMLM